MKFTLLTVAGTAAVSTAFVVPSRRDIYTSPHRVVSRSRPVVSMNLFDRFKRVAKSNLNELVNRMEDPEKIMTQAVTDLQSDLVKIRQSYAEVMATQKKMEKQKAAADKLSAEWMQRAQLAVSSGDDELAREALSRKNVAQEQADSLGAQLATQNSSLEQLFDSMSQLEAKIVEAKAMKEQYIARARTAATSTKVNDMLAGVGDNSMSAFDRMKDKVEQLETTAEVSAGMLGAAKDTSLESRFKQLESGSSVDDELAKLKAGLPPPPGETKQLNPGNSAVDAELEKMRKEMGAQ